MLAKKIGLLSLLLFYFALSKAQELPAERQVDWSLAGLKDTTTTNFSIVDLSNFGINGNGISPNDQVLNTVLSQYENSSGVIIKFPKGSFVFNQPITLPSNTVLTGEGANSTQLIFDLGGTDHAITVAGSANASNASLLTATATKDQTFLQIENSSSFQVGDWIKVNQRDSDLVTDAWAEGKVGQIVQIENISNNRIFLSSPLRRSYLLSNNPIIRQFLPVENVGISCLKIERRDNTAPMQASNIIFRYAVNSWVSAIESMNCTFSHIEARFSSNLKIEKSYLHDAFEFGGGGRGYGVMVHLMSNEVLVENNVFERLRHSMILQAGANGNVLAYNYSFDPYWTSFPADAAGDIVLHGNYIYANLFEQNIVQNIVIDNSHGPNGPNNTFLRNRGESFGIFFSANNSPGQNFIANEVTNSNAPYSLVNYTIQGNDHFIVANNNKGTVDPKGSIAPDIKSFYYRQRPDFLSSAEYGNIGLPNPFNSGTNPAFDRMQVNNPYLNSCGQIITSVADIEKQENKIDLFPNPAQDQIKIESNKIIQKVKLYDLSGKLIGEQSFNNKIVEFDLTNLNQGNYFIKIQLENKFQVLERLVKLSTKK